ncbi:MAG: DEAD/DEAH box helicase [Polyangiales bacterium]
MHRTVARLRSLLSTTAPSPLAFSIVNTPSALDALYTSTPEVNLEPFSVEATMALPRQVNANPKVYESGEQLFSSCNCFSARYGRCEHASALMLDLAICPAMHSLIDGAPVSLGALNSAARTARDAFHSELIEVQQLSSWLVGTRTVVDAPIVPSVEFKQGDLGEHTLLLSLRREGEKARIDPRDLDVLRLPPPFEALVALADPHHGNRKSIAFTGATGAIVLDALREHRIELTKGGHRLEFDPRRAQLAIAVTEVEERRTGRLTAGAEKKTVRALATVWKCDDGTLLSERSGVWFFPGPKALVVDADSKRIFSAQGVDPALVARRPYITPLPIPSDPERAAALYARLRKLAPGVGLAPPPRAQLGLTGAEQPELSLRITGSPLAVRAELAALYSFGTVAVSPGEPESPHVARDLDAERAAFSWLASLGLAWSDELSAFAAEHDAAGRFWSELVPAIKRSSDPTISVSIAEGLESALVRRTIKSRAKIAFKQDWFELDARFDADDITLDPALIRAALASKRRWITLDDGTLAELADAARASATEIIDVLGPRSGATKISRFELGRIDRLADGDSITLDESASRVRERLRALAVSPSPRSPSTLRATLRPYQSAALAWLQFLDELGVGGVLADDMGLGKTVVTLAYLAERKEREGPQCSLVVAPASVVSNWQREAERFAPDLRVTTLTGAARSLVLSNVGQWDVIVASYAMLRVEAEALRKCDLRAVVFDEAQFLKNAASATAESARTITARTRLALSGTPVENHLGELWSILDQVNPGMLSSAKDFEARFGKPISSGDTEASARLRAVTRPFVLRRTKREVLRELPDKEEITQLVAMTPKQRAIYDAIARVAQSDVERAVKEKGVGASALHVLTALLRLRQAACEPALIDPAHAGTSAKREAFLQLVRELVASGRRALVFSQFVSLLSLWRADLDREGIRYVYLDGATVNRDKRVREFQEGTAPLFLLSLKAGGTGLNLTAADTVIHLDPWWNPAVEEQATDRAHRMGQTRKVTVYRLVTEGSVEQKIQKLQAHKRALADAIVKEQQGALAGLTEDDVRMLLGDADAEAIDADTSEPTAPPPPAPARKTRRAR